jgi:hypothetical protein
MHISPRPKHRRGATNEPAPDINLTADELVAWVAKATLAWEAGLLSYSGSRIVDAMASWMTPGAPFVASADALMRRAKVKRGAFWRGIRKLEELSLLVSIQRWELKPWPEGGPGAMRRVQAANAYLPLLPAPEDVYEPRHGNCESRFRTEEEVKIYKGDSASLVDNSPGLLEKWGLSMPAPQARAALDARIAAWEEAQRPH